MDGDIEEPPRRCEGEAFFQEMLSREITLRSLELLKVELPLAEAFHSPLEKMKERLALLLRWNDLEGNTGIGEAACLSNPFYSGEFVSAAALLLRGQILPLLPERGTVGEMIEKLSVIRGWNFTVAGLCEAVFDLQRRKGCPDALDLSPGKKLKRIPAGLALGLFKSPGEAVLRVGKAVEARYHRVKMKIAPGMNIDTLGAVRNAFPALRLGFDANGTLREGDFGFLEDLLQYRPDFIEQPFPPSRADLCLEGKARMPELRICLDESVNGIGDLVGAHRLGILDELNIKPGRVGGTMVALRMIEYCKRQDLPVWVGGMLETGIGRILNARVAARLPLARSHDLSPSSRHFRDDVVENPIRMDPDGFIELGKEEPAEIEPANLKKYLKERIILEKS